MKKRKAARGILLSDSNEILLMRIIVPDTRLSHWVTPGGGIDEGETESECLSREVREETGYDGAISGVAVWKRSCNFTFAGVMYHQEETYFLIKTAKFEPTNLNFADEVERRAFQEFRWWGVDEIVESSEDFIPKDLGVHMIKLLSEGVPKDTINITPQGV